MVKQKRATKAAMETQHNAVDAGMDSDSDSGTEGEAAVAAPANPWQPGDLDEVRDNCFSCDGPSFFRSVPSRPSWLSLMGGPTLAG